MLVQFVRENGTAIAINPVDVAVLIGATELQPVAAASDDEDSEVFGEDDGLEASEGDEPTPAAEPAANHFAIVRFRDGRGYKLRGSYADVKTALGTVNLVEFVRPDARAPNDKLAVNPNNVAAVFGSERSQDVSLLKMPDGRGFKVAGNFEAVHASLANAGLLN